MKVMVTFTFLLMIVVNVLADALPINGQSTAQVSDSYPNLFAPAGFTFAVWGAIYLLLAAYTLYQLGYFGGEQSDKKLLNKIGIYFSISSIANTAWIFSWHYNLIPVSMALTVVILFCLINIVQLSNKELFSKREEIFIRLPFSVYFGWITVASIANAVVLLVSMGWNRFGLTEAVWTILIIFAGAAVGIAIMLKNRDTAYGAVLIWAYSGILFKHISQSGFAGEYTSIITSLAACLALLLITEVHLIKNQ